MTGLQQVSLIIGILLGLLALARAAWIWFEKNVHAVMAGALKNLHQDIDGWDQFWTEKLDAIHDRVDTVASQLHFLQDQVRPNGGSSMRDALDRIERLLQEQSGGH